MYIRARYVALCVLSAGPTVLAQFASVPLGEPLYPDVVVTTWANSTTLSRVEWTEYYPSGENVTSIAPYPILLETPYPVNQIRSCSFAAIDGDSKTDWVLLVHHEPGRASTVEHWEGDETAMAFQQVLFDVAPPPAETIALTFGSLDGDTLPDILTIEDLTGSGPQVVRHYEQGGSGGWLLVGEFPIGVPDARFVALTVGMLDPNSLTDVLLIRDDEEGDISAIDQYEYSGGGLIFARNLVTEPRETHRFQALDIGSLTGARTDLLVLDWFFYELVHQIQRWQFISGELELRQILRESIPPAERLVDISFVTEEACCFFDYTCMEVTAPHCEFLEGQPKGLGSQCLGGEEVGGPDDLCIPSIFAPPGLPPNTEHHARKHRYLSVDATTNGSDEISIKVEIAVMNRCQNDLRRSCIDDEDCPTVCQGAKDTFSCSGDSCGNDGPCIESGPCGPHPNVGLTWYVQEPQTRGVDCPNGMCDEEDYYARVDAAVYGSDWKGECEDVHIPGWTGGCSALHIGDCEIVPGVVYNVYACDAINGDPCSEPLVVETTRKPQLMPHYGDVAGSVDAGNPCCFTPPDAYTSVIDIGAYLLTNKNWGTTTIPQAHPTWIDLHGPGDGIPPQYILNVTDLIMILQGFVNIWPYENTIGGLAPGDCP